MDTANAVMDMIRIKNADNLSTKKPYAKGKSLDVVNSKFSPNNTENEKTIPRMDAIPALRNDAYVHKRSFLFNIRADTDPVSYTHLRAHETRHDLVCRLL